MFLIFGTLIYQTDKIDNTMLEKRERVIRGTTVMDIKREQYDICYR